jgi:tetratricopeptide (TPR) repeat protein
LSFYLHAGYHADRLLFPFRPPVPMLPALTGVPSVEFVSESAAAAWLLNEKNNFARLLPWAAQRDHHEYAWRLAHPLYGIYRRYGFYGELRDIYSVSVASTQAVNDLEAEGATRSDLGLICLAVGDRDAALRELHLAAAIAQQTRGAVWIATSLLHLGTFEAHIGNPDDAEAMYRRALGKLRETRSPGTESAILHRLAETLRERGRHDEALALYRQALDLKQNIGNRHGEAEILTDLAATLCRQGNHDEAQRHGLRSLAIIEQINDVEASPRACLVMAEINHRQGRNTVAIGYARQAVRLAMRNHNAIVEAEALHVLGHALHETGRLAAAEEGWLAAAAIYDDLGNGERRQHLGADLATLREGPQRR